jgi:3-dehydroquinate dehydratase / shikimate dehydrogenase
LPRSPEPSVTYLCVPIFVTELSKARQDIAAAVEAGAEMVELRVDRLDDLAVLDALLLEKLCKTIVTNRSIPEGGFWPPEDKSRAEEILHGPTARLADYIDIELSALKRDSISPALAPVPIVSAHYFAGRPARFYNIVEELSQPPGIAKIVWTARTIRDNLEAFEILQNKQKPTIALCMGEAGIISRILAKKFGGFLTFASLNRDEATAPGQISIEEMKNLYRWDSIRESTRVFGVVAHPVAHSMSPAIHNAAFDDVGYDGIYLAFLVEPNYESFKAFMETFLNFPKLDLSGLSVTIPHKEHALKYLREKGAEIEELAGRIGAVNTIVIDSGKDSLSKLRGSNTDYAAILDCITAAADISRDDLENLRIGVIGAGGTGRTAVAALAHYGATVLITNRTRDRAEKLAEEFSGPMGKVSAVSLAELDGCDVWINTSSVGMHPRVDESPLGNHQPKWTAKTIVFDAVYNPMKTKFLAKAREIGAKTIGGVEMFVRQAAGQFQAWTGKPAPVEIMRAVIENRLSKK